MKVLFLTHKFYPDIGGIEVNSEILATAFYNAGLEVKILTWTKNKGSKTFPFPVIREPNIFKLLELHRWADVVYENNVCLRLAWPSIFFRKPSVIALRTWINRIEGKTSWQDKIKKHWLKRATAVIAVSNSVRIKSWPSATVIGNPYRSDLFTKLPNSNRKKDFVFLGRLVPDKGAAIGIEALHKLITSSHTKNNLTLTIIGEGIERESLEKLVSDYNMQNNVVFTGLLQGQALVSCLNEHRFLLVPSLWEEPFGNVALEGMACGCIPIVSDGGGLPDAAGNAGLVFKRGNVESLVEAIERILNDPAFEKHLLDKADNHLKSHHPDIVSAKYLKVIKSASREFL